MGTGGITGGLEAGRGCDTGGASFGVSWPLLGGWLDAPLLEGAVGCTAVGNEAGGGAVGGAVGGAAVGGGADGGAEVGVLIVPSFRENV